MKPTALSSKPVLGWGSHDTADVLHVSGGPEVLSHSGPATAPTYMHSHYPEYDSEKD